MCWINIPSDSEMISNFDLWLYSAHYVKTNKSSALHSFKGQVRVCTEVYNLQYNKAQIGCEPEHLQNKGRPHATDKKQKTKNKKTQKTKNLENFCTWQENAIFHNAFSFFFFFYFQFKRLLRKQLRFYSAVILISSAV